MSSPTAILRASERVRVHCETSEAYPERYCADDEPTMLLPRMASHQLLAWSQWEPPAEPTAVAVTRDIVIRDQAALAALGDRATRMWHRLVGHRL